MDLKPTPEQVELVDDLSAYLNQAEKLGATTVVPPTEIPDYHLTFACFLDPLGHLVALSKGVAHQPWRAATTSSCPRPISSSTS